MNRWARTCCVGLALIVAQGLRSARAQVVGTSGDDTLQFVGQDQQVNTTQVNPYTDGTLIFDTLNLNGIYNVNTQSYYDGLAGTDTLQMTNDNDFFQLRNASGQQTLFNTERIICSNGNDVLNLSDATYTTGDLFIDGGNGDDIIWTNKGNNTVNGGSGNDQIITGDGNNNISGGSGDDLIEVTGGNNAINAGTGQDWIVVKGNGNNTVVYANDFTYPAGSRFAGMFGTYDIMQATGTGHNIIVVNGSSNIVLTIEAHPGENNVAFNPLAGDHPTVSGFQEFDGGNGINVLDIEDLMGGYHLKFVGGPSNDLVALGSAFTADEVRMYQLGPNDWMLWLGLLTDSPAKWDFTSWSMWRRSCWMTARLLICTFMAI